MKFQDYYQILGVKRDASADEIKKAYRKLALEWHPDRHKGATKEQAESKFKGISEAYAVLSDPEKRKKYDTFGENWEHGQDFRPPPGQGGAQRVSPEDLAKMFGGGFGFSDFFASLFGDETARSFNGSSRGSRRGRPTPRSGKDAHAELELTIGQVIQGGRQTIELPIMVECDTCGGDGDADGMPCPSCGGVGSRRTVRRVEIAIPQPVRDGMQIRLKGLGEPSPTGGPAGDLYLRLSVESDATYRRSGNDVYADVPIAPWEALAGAKIDVRTLDGVVTVRVPPETRANAKLRLPKRGLMGDRGGEQGERGDFYVVVRYQLPDGLTPEQKKAILDLGSHAGAVRGGARE